MGSPDQRKETPKGRDLSILFLAIACILWAVMGALQYAMAPLQSETQGSPSLANIFRTLFSTINTAFIVGATAGLDVYERDLGRLRNLLKKRFPSLFVEYPVWLVMAAFVVIGFGSSMTFMISKSKYANLPDILLSAATLSFVLVGLYKSFKQRGFRSMAWLSIVVVGSYLLVQFKEVPWLENFNRYDDLYWVANLSFKIMLCCLFTALIVSWMYDKAAKKSSAKKPFLRIIAPHENGKKNLFEIEYGYSLNGSDKASLTPLTEKSYLRVLEIAMRWQKMDEPIETHSLYHKSEDEVRQDLSQVLVATRIDPLFTRPGKGLRALQIASDDITIDPEISKWTNWENDQFAQTILNNKKPMSGFPWEGGTKKKDDGESKGGAKKKDNGESKANKASG
jgi:hypothetical protein